MIFTIIEQNAHERYQLNFLVTYSINFFYFHIYDIDFHALSNDISQVLGKNFFVCFLKLKCQSSYYDIYNYCGKYQLNFLVAYSIIFFCFHIYDIDFHALSNDVPQVLRNNFSVCVFAT